MTEPGSQHPEWRIPEEKPEWPLPWDDEPAADFDEREVLEENGHEPSAWQSQAHLLAAAVQAEAAVERAQSHLTRNNVNAAAGAVQCSIMHTTNAINIIEHIERRGQAGEERGKNTPDCRAEAARVDELKKRIREITTTVTRRAHYQPYDQETAEWYYTAVQSEFCLIGARHMAELLRERVENGGGELTPEEGDFAFGCLQAITGCRGSPLWLPSSAADQEIEKRPDGFTVQKHRIAAAAAEQRAETERVANEAAAQYSKHLSLTVSPGLAGDEELINRVRNAPMLYGHAEGGLICRCQRASDMIGNPGRELTRPPEPCTAYVAFLTRAGKHILEVGDAYPKAVPAEDAMGHMTCVIGDIALGGGDGCIWSIQIAARAQAMHDAAGLGVHTISTETVDRVLDEAEATGLPAGAKVLILDGISDDNSNIATLLTQDGRHHHLTDGRMCSRRTAGRIIAAARREGLDAYQLAELAKTMGFNPREVNANPRELKTVERQLIRLAAIRSGLDENAIQRIMDNIDSVQE